MSGAAVAVHGVGTSHFGRQPGRDLVDLAFDAVREAFADAAVDGVDAVWVGTVFGPAGVAQRVLRAMGITGIPIVTVENACASGTTAFAEAHEAVRTGRYGRVLALGIEQMSTAFAGAITPEPSEFCTRGWRWPNSRKNSPKNGSSAKGLRRVSTTRRA